MREAVGAVEMSKSSRANLWRPASAYTRRPTLSSNRVHDLDLPLSLSLSLTSSQIKSRPHSFSSVVCLSSSSSLRSAPHSFKSNRVHRSSAGFLYREREREGSTLTSSRPASIQSVSLCVACLYRCFPLEASYPGLLCVFFIQSGAESGAPHPSVERLSLSLS